MQELKSQVSSCNLKGTSLKKSCHHDDHKWVDSKLEELNSNWSKLQSSCISRQQELENALLRLGQFHEALAELLLWFDEADRMLVGGERGGALGVSIETLESQMKDLQVSSICMCACVCVCVCIMYLCMYMYVNAMDPCIVIEILLVLLL